MGTTDYGSPTLLSVTVVLLSAVSDMVYAYIHFPGRLTDGDMDTLVLKFGSRFTVSHQHA